MRLIINFDSEINNLGFNYQHKLVGCIYKWLGRKNDIHGKTSLFSFSNLRGGKASTKGLDFSDGGYFYVSAYDPTILYTILKNIQSDNTMFDTLKITSATIKREQDLTNQEFFLIATPILLRTYINGKHRSIIYKDSDSAEFLKQNILNKLKYAGLKTENFEISFDTSYKNAKTKMIVYKGINNVVSMCPLIIKGSSEIKNFIINVGIGNSTGIGFGCLM